MSAICSLSEESVQHLRSSRVYKLSLCACSQHILVTFAHMSYPNGLRPDRNGEQDNIRNKEMVKPQSGNHFYLKYDNFIQLLCLGAHSIPSAFVVLFAGFLCFSHTSLEMCCLIWQTNKDLAKKVSLDLNTMMFALPWHFECSNSKCFSCEPYDLYLLYLQN